MAGVSLTVEDVYKVTASQRDRAIFGFAYAAGLGNCLAYTADGNATPLAERIFTTAERGNADDLKRMLEREAEAYRATLPKPYAKKKAMHMQMQGGM